jgi:hypothetical protein
VSTTLCFLAGVCSAFRSALLCSHPLSPRLARHKTPPADGPSCARPVLISVAGQQNPSSVASARPLARALRLCCALPSTFEKAGASPKTTQLPFQKKRNPPRSLHMVSPDTTVHHPPPRHQFPSTPLFCDEPASIDSLPAHQPHLQPAEDRRDSFLFPFATMETSNCHVFYVDRRVEGQTVDRRTPLQALSSRAPEVCANLESLLSTFPTGKCAVCLSGGAGRWMSLY